MKTESYIGLAAAGMLVLGALAFALRLKYIAKNRRRLTIVEPHPKFNEIQPMLKNMQTAIQNNTPKPQLKFAEKYSGKRRFTKAPKS